jgi:hypothetical protein
MRFISQPSPGKVLQSSNPGLQAVTAHPEFLQAQPALKPLQLIVQVPQWLTSP